MKKHKNNISFREFCQSWWLDALVTLAAFLGWPTWTWLHRAVDRALVAREGSHDI